jgi:hypothetical protein
MENARLYSFRGPKGVYRYRNHAEANADMDRWIAETMAERAMALGFKPLLKGGRLFRSTGSDIREATVFPGTLEDGRVGRGGVDSGCTKH